MKGEFCKISFHSTILSKRSVQAEVLHRVAERVEKSNSEKRERESMSKLLLQGVATSRKLCLFLSKTFAESASRFFQLISSLWFYFDVLRSFIN